MRHPVSKAPGLLLTIGLLSASDAQAQPSAIGPTIALPCAITTSPCSPGQVVRNDRTSIIRAGTTMFLAAPASCTVAVTLNADVPPGGSVSFCNGSNRPLQSCVAWFSAGAPDLVVESVDWTKVPVGSISVDAARVVVRNRNGFSAAAASWTRLAVVGCPNRVLEDKTIVTPEIAPGGSTSLTVIVNRPRAMHPYLLAQVNVGGSISESDYTNNLLTRKPQGCPKR